MENYVKAVLYVYPRLDALGRDCEEHIKNRAYLSYDYRTTAERAAEELAEEIIRKELIEALKRTVDEAMENLTEEEKFLLELRYFRRKSRVKKFEEKISPQQIGSVRNYFRRQAKLGEKMAAAFRARGLTKEKFERDYARFDWMASICRFIGEGKAASKRETSLVRFLSGDAAAKGVCDWLKGERKSGAQKKKSRSAESGGKEGRRENEKKTADG